MSAFWIRLWKMLTVQPVWFQFLAFLAASLSGFMLLRWLYYLMPFWAFALMMLGLCGLSFVILLAGLVISYEYFSYNYFTRKRDEAESLLIRLGGGVRNRPGRSPLCVYRAEESEYALTEEQGQQYQDELSTLAVEWKALGELKKIKTVETELRSAPFLRQWGMRWKYAGRVTRLCDTCNGLVRRAKKIQAALIRNHRQQEAMRKRQKQQEALQKLETLLEDRPEETLLRPAEREADAASRLLRPAQGGTPEPADRLLRPAGSDEDNPEDREQTVNPVRPT